MMSQMFHIASFYMSTLPFEVNLQAWSDKSMCTRVPVQQQAYITCVLAMCIAKSGKGCLERAQGLLPAVLQGVSMRLDNPAEAIR